MDDRPQTTGVAGRRRTWCAAPGRGWIMAMRGMGMAKAPVRGGTRARRRPTWHRVTWVLAPVLALFGVVLTDPPAAAGPAIGTVANLGLGIDAPFGIIAGPNGNLWFTDANDNAIGEMGPFGAMVDTFTAPSIDEPYSIVTGPNGNLWFTNYGNSSIGEVTTSGVVSNFTDPSINEPYGIVSGPNGNLWFTNQGNGSIGEITASGVVSNFTDPSIGGPAGITVGPDGNLWYANQWGHSIGRITTSGAVTNFTSSDINGPSAI